MYCDYAATSPIRQVAIDTWAENAHYLNPAGQYKLGRDARRVLETAREEIAALLGAEPIEVIFTASGTEADNMALLGMSTGDSSSHIIASPIEHPAIRESLAHRASQGTQLSYLDVDSTGIVSVDNPVLDTQASVATMMWANNETGAIQPVQEFVARAQAAGTPTHIDAVQVVGHLPINFSELGATTLAASAHKFGGPRGVGFLLAKRTAPLHAVLFGGGQERRLRPGTVDVAGAAATAAALTEAYANHEAENAHIRTLRNTLRERIQKSIPNVIIHTPEGDDSSLPGHLYVSFIGAEGDSLIMLLDAAGIACSTGSACSSGVNRASEVLLAQGVSEKDARSALRFSLGRNNTTEEVENLLNLLPDIVERARLAGMA
ncbi:MAG: cysteine desulfurase family protein [Corynebacterium sp.]|nr:cysteine desulfurase family protein [Corynebacterium sp.]